MSIDSAVFRSIHSTVFDTGGIELNENEPFPPQGPVGIEIVALAVAALLEREKLERCSDPATRRSPWTYSGACRLTWGTTRHLRFRYGNRVLDVTLNTTERGATLYYAGLAAQFARQCKGEKIRIDLGARRMHGKVHIDGEAFHISSAGRHIRFFLDRSARVPG